ncbi:MAG: pilin, partial [Candidatus Uhrbacteria bacterium]
MASTLGTLTAAESALVTQANTSACPDVNICIACQQVCENYFLTDHDRFVFIPEGATQDTFDFEIEQCNIAAGNPTATTEPEEPPTPPILPRLSVEIPGLTFTEPLEKGGYLEIDFIGQYVAALYKWMLGAGALIAVVMVMIGGLQYMIGKGAGDIQKGKDRMKNAVIG